MKKDLILEELVIKEATNLKKYATKEELAKLKYKDLDGDSVISCIYGQITDSCLSKRSQDLIIKCCEKVYKTDASDNRIVNAILNGKPKKIKFSHHRLDYYASPIERFLAIYKPDEWTKSIKIKKLVDFLQDKTQELKF